MDLLSFHVSGNCWIGHVRECPVLLIHVVNKMIVKEQLGRWGQKPKE